MIRRRQLEQYWRERVAPDVVASSRPIRIGNAVWIGFDAVVLPGVTIGDGSIIGARSVVTEDVPPYCIAVGNPARIVRRLEPAEVHHAVAAAS
jgi:acetyltransferase-like isoleucine patch superfamily enzyme